MSSNLYITATEARSGKSAISLGIMELLLRNVDKIGFFRPIIKTNNSINITDNDIDLISSHFNLDTPYEEMYAYSMSKAHELINLGRKEEVLETIFNKYNRIKKNHDFVLCEGTDFEGSASAFEFDINAEIANNLASPVLLVANAKDKTIDESLSSIEISLKSLFDKGCNVIATVVNRIEPENADQIKDLLTSNILSHGQLVYTIPNETILGNPTVGEIAKVLNAEVLYGENLLNKHVHSFTVAAMQLQNLLKRIKHGTLIITPGDRIDVILASFAAVYSTTIPNIAGIMLTGGLKPEGAFRRLLDGFPIIVPILSVNENTYPTAIIVDNIHAAISPEDKRKIARLLEVFDLNVHAVELSEKIIKTETSIITPKMFEYRLVQKASEVKQHVVLPEGEEERILRAAEILLRRDIVEITLLGDKTKIQNKIIQLGLQMDGVNLIEPQKSGFFDDYVATYYDLRKHKGITIDNARDIMEDETFFGTMMVFKGNAGGMVSGAVHTTGNTIRPAFQIIKTKPGFTIVSSIFFMCLKDRVLVYGDCAVNPNPNANELAEIALSSAQTAKIFGIEPRIAMLSYSTGKSGKGADVDIVREATEIARKKAKDYYPDVKLEGPIQYDAAVDMAVARTKMPDSEVAGRATVLIFPDLNTGNNTYKAVQRSSGAIAIGPILQGLNKPVNDLSRGCTIPDIVNTVAITAIQAQVENGKME